MISLFSARREGEAAAPENVGQAETHINVASVVRTGAGTGTNEIDMMRSTVAGPGASE